MRHQENILRDLPRPHGRPAIWLAIRSLHLEIPGGVFTVRNVWEHANHHQRGLDTDERTVRSYLACLVAAKIVALSRSDEPRRYQLIRDLGPATPRVRKNGTFIKQGNATQRMWMALRVQGTFTHRELAYFASVGDRTAQEYCHFLGRAEYLRIVRKSKPGTPAKYRFNRSKNTGPEAPMIQRIKALYDPNIRKTVYARNVGSWSGEASP